MAASRYTKAIKLIKEAQDLARSGALVLDDGAAAIYFLWGQPSHAYIDIEGVRVQGDAALKEIALALAQPGMLVWHGKDVLPLETLRCNPDELLEILGAMSGASQTPSGVPIIPRAPVRGEPPTPAWGGEERRRGPALHYSLSDFPLLPSGSALWADVPTSVIHLDVLIGTLQTVLVVCEAPSARAAGIVHNGERYDAIFVDEEGVTTGRAAWERMIAAPDGSVSAYDIDPAVARTLPVLWRNRILHRDLETGWISRNQFLAGQSGDGEDRAIIVATPDVIGIALFSEGHPIASYTTADRVPTLDVSPVQALIAEGGDARITVLERVAEDTGDAFRVTAPVEAPLAEDDVPRRPVEFEPFEAAAESGPAEPAPAEAEASPPPPADAAPSLFPMMSSGSEVRIADFASLLDNPRAPITAAAPAAAPPDFDDVLAELTKIGERFVGEEFATLAPSLLAAPRTPQGLRDAIAHLRGTTLTSHGHDDVTAMARAMQLYISDRLSAI